MNLLHFPVYSTVTLLFHADSTLSQVTYHIMQNKVKNKNDYCVLNY